VILLDNSYSMGYAARWEQARAAARDAVNKLGPTDHASVVLFSSDAEVAARSTSERGRLLAAIDAASPSAGATRYAPALKVAGTILGESSLPRLEAVVEPGTEAEAIGERPHGPDGEDALGDLADPHPAPVHRQLGEQEPCGAVAAGKSRDEQLVPPLDLVPVLLADHEEVREPLEATPVHASALRYTAS